MKTATIFLVGVAVGLALSLLIPRSPQHNHTQTEIPVFQSPIIYRT